MTVTPKIHLTAWEDRKAQFIFVAVPNERGRYARTEKPVAFVGCPHCGALVGEPCTSGAGDGYSGTIHSARRHAARKFHGVAADDILHPEDTTTQEEGAAWPPLPSA